MIVYTPNLPALITALPGDATRAPQTEFDRTRQVLFLENLSVTGSVRSAASAGGVSHQTAYRARRATAAFRTAWDAALVVARVSVADTVGCRAIDGITEPVFYHGEEVGSRTRFSDRLLLAHLARLDRLAEAPAASAFAEDFDEALAGFGRGEVFVAPEVGEPPHEVPAAAGTQQCTGHRAPALRQAGRPAAQDELPGGQAGASGDLARGDFLSPEPCNTRSMSYTAEDADAEADSGDSEDDFGWDDEEAEAEFERTVAAMEAQRPAGSRRLDLEDRSGLTEDAQIEAFERAVPEWWRVLPPAPPAGSDQWVYHEDGDGEWDDDSDACEEADGEDEEWDEGEPEGDGEDGASGDDRYECDGAAAIDASTPRPAAAPELEPAPEHALGSAGDPSRQAPRAPLMKTITVNPPLWIDGCAVPQPPTIGWE